MTERPIPDSPPPSSPVSPTSPVDFEKTLGRAIDAGQLDPALAAADLKLAGAVAAHQKLESLFAALRGNNDPLSLRERAWVKADSLDDAPPAQFGRYQARCTLGAFDAVCPLIRCRAIRYNTAERPCQAVWLVVIAASASCDIFWNMAIENTREDR